MCQPSAITYVDLLIQVCSRCIQFFFWWPHHVSYIVFYDRIMFCSGYQAWFGKYGDFKQWHVFCRNNSGLVQFCNILMCAHVYVDVVAQTAWQRLFFQAQINLMLFGECFNHGMRQGSPTTHVAFKACTVLLGELRPPVSTPASVDWQRGQWSK